MTMRFALVQGDVSCPCTCIEEDGYTYCIDKEILDLYPETFTLDFIENQGFRLYTNSQYMATHMRILASIEEV
jgi:hypothetical protein